jgi:hypothetical protein
MSYDNTKPSWQSMYEDWLENGWDRQFIEWATKYYEPPIKKENDTHENIIDIGNPTE